MSAFKNQLMVDVKGTFLNLDEFSDMHEINGVVMRCQIDNNEQIEREKRQPGGDGIYRNQKLLYVVAEDFGNMPKQNSLLKLDGKVYIVKDAISEQGIYSITVEAHRS